MSPKKDNLSTSIPEAVDIGATPSPSEEPESSTEASEATAECQYVYTVNKAT